MKTIFAFLTLTSIALGVMIVLTAYMLAVNSGGIVGSSDVELSFMRSGRELHLPVRFYDRSQSSVLFEVLDPAAQSRRWYQIDPDGPIVLPEHVILASVSAQDRDYWETPSSPLLQTLNAFTIIWNPSAGQKQQAGIVDLLADAQVVPFQASGNHNPAFRAIQRQLAVAELSARYTRVELLEFFINTADYGNLAYGIDAAALVYFGKHAEELSLAEGAMLAPIPFEPQVNPFDAPRSARTRQQQLLAKMRDGGLISRPAAQRALSEELTFNQAGSSSRSSLGDFLLAKFGSQFGNAALGRNGLQVRTTIDADLQEQSQCVLSTHINRLNDEVLETPSSECLASELLPPLRPGDAGKDHEVGSGALVVMDAVSGEILSLVGAAELKRPMGTMVHPFVYLTAFAEGYSPGSMVLDLPASSEAEDPASVDFPSYHGPVRIRSAMANGYTAAAEQMVELVGVESVLRIFKSMGVEVGAGPDEKPETWRATLLDLVHANSVFADGGLLAGQVTSDESEGVQPIVILDVLDAAGRLAFTANTGDKAVLSEQLAYLVNDVLSDDVERQETFGPSNPLEVHRPAGATAAVTTTGRDAWALGYTPERVVGVWLGNPSGSPPNGLTIRNSAAPIWHALMVYATRDMPPGGWQLPLGVARVEVCEPSGLLPTRYCPEIVREPFISGTEPTTFDNLYQPYLVNKETGKLATLSTPVELVEERVYLVPPPEAADWANAIGLAKPPQEYDTLTEAGTPDRDLRITSPDPFEFLRGVVRVRGYVDLEDLDFYRLQIGKGLNPLNWLQLGEDRSQPVRGGTLAEWDTGELEGLYTLQLIAVESDEQVRTAIVHVTIDNEPPAGEVVFPQNGQVFTGNRTDEVAVQVEAQDSFGVDRVVFFIDSEEAAVVSEEPYSFRWPMRSTGIHSVYAEIHDLAGNQVLTEEVT
ncbi:MAG: transglycosylase domain-containing protein, partial [Anaerolineales bacterium]